MELKEFISKTLLDITQGIREGQELSRKDNKSYAPEQPLNITFDVSVHSEESATTGGSAKITVAGIFGGKIGKEEKNNSLNYSRIKFDLSVKLNTEKSAV